jgi:Spy/CpxP family protein refolding chaperone
MMLQLKNAVVAAALAALAVASPASAYAEPQTIKDAMGWSK